MPSAKVTAFTDLAGNQSPADLVYVAKDPFGATDDRKSTLNDLISEITKNVTDKSIQFAGGSVATVSAASKGKIRYNEITQTFQASRNTAAYLNLVVGSGNVQEVTVWDSSSDRITGYPRLIYDDANRHLRLFVASSFLPMLTVEDSQAAAPRMVRVWGGSGLQQIFNFQATASLALYRGASGPAFPGSGVDVAQIVMDPVTNTSSAPTTVGGARLLVTTTQAAVLGVGGGVGLVLETAGNNETGRTRRFLINQHGCVVVGANGQGITGTYGGTSTNVVLGQLTTYNSDAAIQCGNPFTGNNNITYVIQANAGQTKAVFQLETSAGAAIYSVGSSGSHTYIGIGGGVAVSPANQGRIYYDTVSQAFKVSQNGGAYVNMISGAVTLTVGSTAIASGSAGRLMYESSTNVLGETAGYEYSPTADWTLKGSAASGKSGLLLAQPSSTPVTNAWSPALLQLHTGGNTGIVFSQDANSMTWAQYQFGNSLALFESFAPATAYNYMYVHAGGAVSGGYEIYPNGMALGVSGPYYGGFGFISSGTFGLMLTTSSPSSGAQFPLAWTDSGVGINKTSSISAQLHVVSGSASRVALRVDSLANSTVGLNEFFLDADNTATVALHSTFTVNSNGTAATSFGGQLLFQLESSTTNSQDAASIDWVWTDATHASRSAAIVFNTVHGAAALTERWRIGSAGWLITKEISTDPTTTELAAGDQFALYRKNDKLVFAYNNGGTITYLTIPFDGATTTWTQSTTAP